MNYVKGKIRKTIFQNKDNGFCVLLFKVSETNTPEFKDKINKIITITGIFTDVLCDMKLKVYGNYVDNERFGNQFKVESYEVEIPTSIEAIEEFLSSSFIQGCGEVTAKKIVEKFGDKALEIIKNDKDRLLEIEGMTLSRATKISTSIASYNKSSDTILKLENLGFSIEECSRIYKKYEEKIDYIIDKEFYSLKKIIDFDRLDSIYVSNYGNDTLDRLKNCFLTTIDRVCLNEGDTYTLKENIINGLRSYFRINISMEEYEKIVKELVQDNEIYIDNEKIYLKSYHDAEVNIANTLKKIDSFKIKKIPDLDLKLKELEKNLGIDYNKTQEDAILSSLNNNITIISGGPGTGKTTIINAIVKLYIKENRLASQDILNDIALLAPTGRASKKLSNSTHEMAQTIHRYLKWYKDSEEFTFNEFNKTKHKLIIVDEVSMIDIMLFDALLKGISTHVKLILVGDVFQLPSVGPGLVLSDLIRSDYFNYIELKEIYRQSDNSYIPYLAQDIKNNELNEEVLSKRDDYNFINVDQNMINSAISQIVEVAINKGIDEEKMQILAPMYRGVNGIDNLNYILRDIYNPSDISKNEIKYGDIIYRENDKVLQLVNDLDNNVFNGDIGFITKIIKDKIFIDYDGNEVLYDKVKLKEIKHAYAITIHKAQGSEFEHVLMPISPSYSRMLYNKLIYTGVSRAKKSLTIVGSAESFSRGVANNYSTMRKTTLKEELDKVYLN